MSTYDAVVETGGFIVTGEYLRRREKEESAPVTQTGNNIEMLGWTPAEAFETHIGLRSFAEDWNYPGMEAYDEL